VEERRRAGESGRVGDKELRKEEKERKTQESKTYCGSIDIAGGECCVMENTGAVCVYVGVHCGGMFGYMGDSVHLFPYLCL